MIKIRIPMEPNLKTQSDDQVDAANQVLDSCKAQALRDFGDYLMKAGFSDEEAQKYTNIQDYGK